MQQQGRLRLENAKRREVRAMASRIEVIGSERALALVGPSAFSGVGDEGRLLGALPVRGECAFAKRDHGIDLCPASSRGLERRMDGRKAPSAGVYASKRR